VYTPQVTLSNERIVNGIICWGDAEVYVLSIKLNEIGEEMYERIRIMKEA
jgi:hypothetical protein